MSLNTQILGALRTFDAAARLGSFTRAAIQLHITPAAVSQQIRHLEQQLNITLFERHSRGIRLTEKGHSLHLVVKPSLNNIASAIATLQDDTVVGNEVRVKSTPSFAFKWLVPRLSDFYHQNPEIQIHIFADGALVDTSTSDYDLAIDFAPTPYPNHESDIQPELLMQEALVPVMSPDYAAQHNWQDPNTWKKVSLLHDTMPWLNALPEFEWRYWFKNQQLDAQYPTQNHYFNRADLAMEAAVAGQGVALARSALLSSYLKTEALVSPFEPIASDSGYYLFEQRNSDQHNPSLAVFKQWLIAQVAR